MQTLHTIGHTQKSLQDFINRLQNADVDCVIDIRLHNTSQLAGFSKKDDLEFLLTQGFGIGYIHMPEFAPSEDILATFKADKDWEAYEEKYLAQMESEWMVYTFIRAAESHGWDKPCLLCAEDKPQKCHRRLLAEAVQEQLEGLEVKHL